MPHSSLQCAQIDCLAEPTHVVNVYYWHDQVNAKWTSETFYACAAHTQEAERQGRENHGDLVKDVLVLENPPWLRDQQHREGMEALRQAERFFQTGEAPAREQAIADKPTRVQLNALQEWAARGGQARKDRRGGRKERR